jgi:tripartite-type tricarboxylate transporter receptor subunit TctC
MTRLVFGLLLAALAPLQAVAEEVSFQGKSVTMIIGYAAGGGTDVAGRVIASFLDKHLPGSPTIVVRNMPGADGITATNYFVQQVVPDGNTIIMASSTTADPLNYRKPQAHFDPTTFGIIGGIGRGGTMLLVNKEAEKRLHDKSERPVVMGTIGGVPRSGMQMTAWGIDRLGWNARWVVGYRGTSDLMLAMERGEIDMTATANLFFMKKLVDTGKFKILAQSGMPENGVFVPRPDLGDAPVIASLLKGRIDDPLVHKAFDFWSSIVSIDKWLALPPKSPPAMLAVYRKAFEEAMKDPAFLERGQKMSEDFVPMTSAEVTRLVATLGGTPKEATDYIAHMLRGQGLQVDSAKEGKK